MTGILHNRGGAPPVAVVLVALRRLTVLLFLLLVRDVASFQSHVFTTTTTRHTTTRRRRRCCATTTTTTQSGTTPLHHHHPTTTRQDGSLTPLSAAGTSSTQQQQQQQRVVVVGGGIGGLVVASRIAASSCCRVTLLEQNPHAGGRCGSWHHVVSTSNGKKRAFRHERGPSLLLLPHVYAQVFDDCCGTAAAASSSSFVSKNSTTTTTAHAAPATMRDFGLTIVPCRPAYQVVFDDGERLDVGFPKQQNALADSHTTTTTSMEEREQQSRTQMNAMEPDGARKWDAYLRTCQAFLDCGLPNFIEERLDLTSLPAFVVESLRQLGQAWPLKPHSEVLDAMFVSDKMKALASFQDLYVGLEPYRNDQLLAGGVLETTAPAVFGLLSAIELHPTNDKCGVYAPLGGFQAVTDSLCRLATHVGVDIQCHTTVVRVSNDGVYCYRTNENTTITTNASNNHTPAVEMVFEPADLIVVNADLPYATKSLLDQRDESIPIARPAINEQRSEQMMARYDWDDQYRYSCGVIAFHWSLDQSLDDLNTHNVFLSASNRTDAKQSWSVLRDNRNPKNRHVPFTSPDQPFNFYVHRASHTDPSAAPRGMDAILVLVPCPTLERDPALAALPRDQALRIYRAQFDDSYIDRVREAVWKRLSVIESLQNIRDHVVHEVVDTPATYADQYNVGAGTPFALSHGLAQLSRMRPAAPSNGTKKPPLPNVLFCGASTRPGNGVPLVMIGAKQIAEKAITMLADKRRTRN